MGAVVIFVCTSDRKNITFFYGWYYFFDFFRLPEKLAGQRPAVIAYVKLYCNIGELSVLVYLSDFCIYYLSLYCAYSHTRPYVKYRNYILVYGFAVNRSDRYFGRRGVLLLFLALWFLLSNLFIYLVYTFFLFCHVCVHIYIVALHDNRNV